MATPIDSTASRALVRKMRLRSEERNFFIEPSKSSSVAPPSGTVTARGSEDTPSFQAMTV